MKFDRNFDVEDIKAVRTVKNFANKHDIKGVVKKYSKKVQSVAVIASLGVVCTASITAAKQSDVPSDGRVISISDVKAEADVFGTGFDRVSYEEMKGLRYESDQYAKIEVSEKNYEAVLLAKDADEKNKEALRKVFVEFNVFYKKIGLFGKKMIALDSVKVKANNSKKRNHNKKTVEKTIKKTEERINEYMTALDEADKNEGINEERALTSEQIKEILTKLNAKKINLKICRNSLKKGGETQISETEPDSRCMEQGSGKGMDISYNTQVVTEAV